STGVLWNYTTVLNIIFLLLAAALIVRFFRSGGARMLRMMGAVLTITLRTRQLRSRRSETTHVLAEPARPDPAVHRPPPGALSTRSLRHLRLAGARGARRFRPRRWPRPVPMA